MNVDVSNSVASKVANDSLDFLHAPGKRHFRHQHKNTRIIVIGPNLIRSHIRHDRISGITVNILRDTRYGNGRTIQRICENMKIDGRDKFRIHTDGMCIQGSFSLPLQQGRIDRIIPTACNACNGIEVIVIRNDIKIKGGQPESLSCIGHQDIVVSIG